LPEAPNFKKLCYVQHFRVWVNKIKKKLLSADSALSCTTPVSSLVHTAVFPHRVTNS
jgi:hypothetical protein